MKRFFMLLVSLLSAVVFYTLSADEFKIGVLYPLAGTGAVYGKPAMFGHDMAVDEINAAGGLLGKKVVSFPRDTKLKPAAAAAAAKELITKNEVDVLVGGLSSAVGLAISEVARQERVLYIATIPKTIKLTTEKLHRHVFRTASNTDFEGDGLAQMAAQLGAKKICDIQLDYAYGHDLSAGVKAGLARHAPAAEVVIELRPKLGATDYNAFITQMMGVGCDVAISGLWGSHFVNFAQQAKPFGLFERIKYITGGEIGSHEIAGKMKGDFPDNVYANSYELFYHHYAPSHVVFQKELAKRSGSEETAMWPALTYTGVKFLEAAAKKAQSTDTDALISALEGLTITTPMGPRTINAEDHQADMGEFYGPMVKKAGKNYRVMDPVTYIPARIAK